MQLLAPAKINLHLRVGRRRDDGFHPLLTWMCTVGLFDSLTLQTQPPARRGSEAGAIWVHRRAGVGAAGSGVAGQADAPVGVGLRITGGDDRPDLPRDASNLVVRIATAFLEALLWEPAVAGQRPLGGPAFLDEEGTVSRRPEADRASAAGRGEQAASVGAVPGSTPGLVGESARGSGGEVNHPAVPGSRDAGVGAGNDSEGLGRSNRHDNETPHDLSRPPRVVIELTKRIPVGAGLGGGSSDAAHTLVGLDRLLASNWSAERLSGFGARLGSDVPFFVEAAVRGATSAACRGRGELVRPVARPAARWAVVFSPPFALATRDVYERFDAMGLGNDPALDPEAEPDWAAWASLPARDLMGRLVNDLEPPAFAISPALAQLRADLSRVIGRVVRMSGSGSSLFTLFDADEEDAAGEAAAVAAGKGMAAVVAEMTPAPRVTT
jgi:4-diphosphocytidyl-2C-methyl-D-erythritol kinase